MPRYIDAVNFGSRLRAVAEKSIQKDYNQFLMEETKSETAGLLRTIEILNSQPTVDVQEVKHGRWILDKKGTELVCSVCGGFAPLNYYNYHRVRSEYCPDCGAIMGLKENKEPMPQYIKLDSVINDIKKECLSCRYKDTDNCQDCTIDRRIHSIEHLCSSEPFYWETWAGDLLKCPACKHEYTDAVECTNFCGNCGVPLKFKKEE